MSLTRAAIEKNQITAVVMMVIVFAGISAFQDMPQNEDPGFIIRTAQVLTFFPGALVLDSASSYGIPVLKEWLIVRYLPPDTGGV